MCCESGKIGYATKDLAETALNMAIIFKEKTKTQPKRTYLCPECDRFHLTSQDKN